MNDSAPAIPLDKPARLRLTPASAHPVLDAETQQFLDIAAEAGVPGDQLLRHANLPRDGTQPGGTSDATTVDITVPGAPGIPDFLIRIVRPSHLAGVLPVALYFPGGGWRGGACITHDRLVRRIATQAGVAVALVEYTPVPLAHYPTQTEQGYLALSHIAAHAAQLAVDGCAIAVVGEGGGANIAATVAMLAKIRRGPQLALQALICPVLTASEDNSSHEDYAEGPGMTAEGLREQLRAQFAESSQQDKFAMPLQAPIPDLEDLPPSLIITAESDLVRDDGEAYARNLMRAGVPVSAVRCLGTIHDFIVLDGLAETPPVRTAVSLLSMELRSSFSGYLSR